VIFQRLRKRRACAQRQQRAQHPLYNHRRFIPP
jgi:hypothetical protein